MKQRKEFHELLTEKNLRKTSQRALIWGVLLKVKGHPSVEEIRELLLAKGHRIGLATVYRTLKILLASGYIRQSRQGGMTRYESVVSEPNHIHFTCNLCGRTVEFPSRRVESVMKDVTARHGFQERYSRYVISGICKACQLKREKSAGLSERQKIEKTAVRDALELTLLVERVGFRFYMKASKRTKNENGRLMFQRLAAEESEHLRRLQQEYQLLIERNDWLKHEPARLPISRKIADEIFPEKQLLKYKVHDETTELEALSIAMDLERRSHRFFKTFARQMENPTGRKAFLAFASDEQDHLDTLEREYNTRSGA